VAMKFFTACVVLSTSLAGLLGAGQDSKIFLDCEQILIQDGRCFLIGDHQLYKSQCLHFGSRGVYVHLSDLTTVGQSSSMVCSCDDCCADDLIFWRGTLLTPEQSAETRQRKILSKGELD
jgi:hypothetical protein